MPDLPPDLAKKVVAADLRNHVKRIGEGGNLAPADRQMFISLGVGATAEELRKTRTTSLLRKWLFGGRISKEERAELGDVLPAAPARITRESYAEKPEHYHQWYGIERRMFFRWLAQGRSVADGPDLPPFDQPQDLSAWYERMRDRSVFKNRMPRKVLERIEQLARSAPAPAAPPSTDDDSPAPSDGKQIHKHPAPPRPAAEIGLRFEIEQQERRVAGLREARDAAYAQGLKAEGDILARQYASEMDSFTVWKARALKQAEQEGLLVWKSEVEADFAERLPSIVTGGMFLFDRIAPKLEAATSHAAKRAIWRVTWIEHCRKLAESKFAPPFNLEALTA